MAGVGKSLAFDVTEIDELLELKYNQQRTFSVLSLLYPGLDFSKEFHEDHVFPKSLFTAKRLSESGIPQEQIEEYQARVNCLPNLQLIGGVPNIEKQAKLPTMWLAGAFPSDEQRETYLRENDLESLPLDLSTFLEFFAQRRERMRARLITLLGITDTDGPSIDGELD